MTITGLTEKKLGGLKISTCSHLKKISHSFLDSLHINFSLLTNYVFPLVDQNVCLSSIHPFLHIHFLPKGHIFLT